MALIMAGQYDQANEAIDTLAGNFAGNPDLPETLYWVAERFKRFDRFEDAKLLYQRIVDNYPESPWAAKAGFAVARADVMLLFLAGDYSGVNESLDKLAVDFAGNPDLPEALYWITERFERQSRFAEAGQNYERIVRDYPYSQFAASAKLGASKAEIMGLVMSGQYEQAGEALDKLSADFAGHPDLPWALYWIGERYERAGRPYEALNVYRRIAEDYPSSTYAEKANSRIAELGVAAPVELQDSNQAGEDVSTAALEQEESAVELYRLAREYEDQPEMAALAGQTYQQLIEQYPGTIKADKAVLDIRRLEIQDALDSEDANTAEALLDKFIVDFKDHPYAIGCLDRAGTKYYLAARELKKKGQLQQARENFARAEGIWQRVIVDLSEGFVNPAGPGGFYYIIAVCRQEQKNWAGAIEYFQNVAADYPDFEYVCGAQAAVGWCYEALRDAENLSKEAVDPIIEEAYTAVLVTYPDCYIAHHAAYRLGEMSYEKGDDANAILYYRKFLTLAKSSRPWHLRN